MQGNIFQERTSQKKQQQNQFYLSQAKVQLLWICCNWKLSVNVGHLLSQHQQGSVMSELKTGIQEGSEKYQHFSIREQNYKHYIDDQHDEFSLQKTQTSKQYNYKAKQCRRLKVSVLKEVKQGLAWQYQFQCMNCAFVTMYMCIKSGNLFLAGISLDISKQVYCHKGLSHNPCQNSMELIYGLF